MTYQRFIAGSRDSGFFDAESMGFQERILHKSGLSEETFFPPGAAGARGAGRQIAAAQRGVEWCGQRMFGSCCGCILGATRRPAACPARQLPPLHAARHRPLPQACTWTPPSLT